MGTFAYFYSRFIQDLVTRDLISYSDVFPAVMGVGSLWH